MPYELNIYADEYGNYHTASDTDQAGRRNMRHSPVRTVAGKPVVSAGHWWAAQLPYKPFKEAVTRAGVRAGKIQSGFRIVPLHGQDPITVHCSYEQALEEARERNADVFVEDVCLWKNPAAKVY